MEWTLSPQGNRWGIRCSYERHNPEPECGACGECDLCEDWTPVDHCPRSPRIRAQICGDVADICSLEEHAAAGVEWWAPLYGPIFESMFDQTMKYFYRESMIESAAMRERPLLSLLRSRA